jgi:hypothetical protein
MAAATRSGCKRGSTRPTLTTIICVVAGVYGNIDILPAFSYLNPWYPAAILRVSLQWKQRMHWFLPPGRPVLPTWP